VFAVRRPCFQGSGPVAVLVIPALDVSHPYDPESICHLVLGWFAGNLSPQVALVVLAAFTGYQLSQAEAGESFPRIGSELMEFALGLLLAQFIKMGS
jgi:hypothetical protein